MSNTDWYAALEASEPWKAFNDYQRSVQKIVAFSHSDQRNGVDASTNSKSPVKANFVSLEGLFEGLSDVVAECQAIWDSLPISQRTSVRRCAGLPRSYPKEWMRRPKSNSLMLEFRDMQSRPTNGLRSQD